MPEMKNEAVWFALKGDRGTVGPSQLHRPGPGQLLIENKAIAINPVDWKMRDSGIFVPEWPLTLGFDLAGDVVEIGPCDDSSQSSPFKIGQRVMAHALFLQFKEYSQAAFQRYTIVLAAATCPLPDAISYSSGSVLPLSINTAVAGLYTGAHLNLPLPTTTTAPNSLNKAILVWGGSGSVGASAVQLASASGLTVISTSSPHNFDFVKSLGAKHVLNYNSPNTIAEIISLLQGTDFVGAYDGTGSTESAKACSEIVSRLGGGHVASALATSETEGVTSKMVMAPSPVVAPNEHVGRGVWKDFLPEALRTGQMKTAPPAKVVGHGLEAVPAAVEEMKKGVSALKLVVTL